jgi:hypothetical protein
MSRILAHLKQRSTLAGLGTIAALFGLPPVLGESVGQILVAAIAVFEIFRHER